MVTAGIAIALCVVTAFLMLHEAHPHPKHLQGRHPPGAPPPDPIDAPTAVLVVEPDATGNGSATAEEAEALLATTAEAWLVPMPDDQPDGLATRILAEKALEPGPAAIRVGSLDDPLVAAAAAHPDYEIVELPAGPTILRIGAPQRRPDAAKLIQTEVLVREGPAARTLALARLATAIGVFGLALGFGLVFAPKIAAWVIEVVAG
jgi:hypothetical protein